MPILVHHISRDADEIQEAARAWSVDFRAMESAPGDSELVQTLDSTAVISWAHLAPRVEQRGAAPAEMRTFALLGRDAPDITWCGTPVGRNTLMVFGAGGEFEASSPAGFGVHTLSVAADRLDAVSERLGIGSVDQLGPSLRVTPLPAPRAAGLRRTLEAVTRLIVERPVGDDALRATLADDIAPQMLRAALGSGEEPPPPTSRSRDRALRLAVEYIEAQAARAPRVADLCAAAGCSERTLRYAFEEQFGMSPKRYLQAVRLNGVRGELRGGGGQLGVSDAANRWGFWHMGQLAADYRQLFGELPSETLARWAPDRVA